MHAVCCRVDRCRSEVVERMHEAWETDSHGEGGRMSSSQEGSSGGPSLRERARAMNPGPMVPVAACVAAAAMWLGCALADAGGFASATHARSAAWLVMPFLATAGAGAVAIGVLVAIRRVGRTVALLLVALTAGSLGAGLRFDESARVTAVPQVLVAADAVDGGQLVVVEATVASGWTRTEFGSDILARYFAKQGRMRAMVEDVVFVADDGMRLALGRTARLSLSFAGEVAPCAFGERVRVVGRLMPVARSSLPGRGDHVRCVDQRMEWAARNGLVGTLLIDDQALVSRVEGWRTQTPLIDWMRSMRETVRSRMRDALVAGVPDDGRDAVDAMLVALVLGDVEEGYREIENSFRAVGLAHILAISGFNLAILGWLIAALAALVVRSERWRAVAVAGAAVGALLVMAPAASAVRSALMAIVGAGGRAFDRDWNGDGVIAVAAMLMLVHAPSDAVGPGFQLSFGCVLALRHLAPAIRTRWFGWLPRDGGSERLPAWICIVTDGCAGAISAGLAASLASAPVVLVHFGSLQPMAVLMTLACSPLSTLTLVIAYPKAIIGILWPAAMGPVGWLVWLPAWIQVRMVDWSVVHLAGSMAVGAIPAWCGACSVAGVVAGVRLSMRSMRMVSWVVAIAVPSIACAVGQSGDARPAFELTAFAVGDGSAYLIRSEGRVILFDGGSSSNGSVASGALIDAIVRAGGCVDMAVVSHPNLDHYSALVDVARYTRVAVACVHPSFVEARRSMPAVEALLSEFERLGTEVRTIAAGDTIELAPLRWRVLWPGADFRSRRDNDLSLVSIVEHSGGARLLLSGDIETEPAARLAAMARRGEVDLACDILELPHHGSWREAVVDYMCAARPAFVVQSTARKRFAADRFASHIPRGASRLVTCRDGTVRITLGADGALHAWTWDVDAVGGWRPVGRADVQRRRDTMQARSSAIESPTIPLPPSVSRISIDAAEASVSVSATGTRRWAASSRMGPVLADPQRSSTSTAASTGAGSAITSSQERTESVTTAPVLGSGMDAMTGPATSMVASPSSARSDDPMRTASATPRWNSPGGTETAGLPSWASGWNAAGASSPAIGLAALLSEVRSPRILASRGSASANPQPASASKRRSAPSTTEPSSTQKRAPPSDPGSDRASETAATRSIGTRRFSGCAPSPDDWSNSMSLPSLSRKPVMLSPFISSSVSPSGRRSGVRAPRRRIVATWSIAMGIDPIQR